MCDPRSVMLVLVVAALVVAALVVEALVVAVLRAAAASVPSPSIPGDPARCLRGAGDTCALRCERVSRAERWPVAARFCHAYRDAMAITPSPEIESVVRRALHVYTHGEDAAHANLFSADPSLRVLGFAEDEWWRGPEEVFQVRRAQAAEMPDMELDVHMVEGFEDGPLGWATLFVTMTTPEGDTLVRVTVVLRLEAAAWRIVQWHNSIPVSNHQVFGVELTTTLRDLVTSILAGDFELDNTTSEGTMTLVFTDIVDSTMLAESLGDAEWVQLIKAHEETIRRLTGATGGKVVKFLGDGSMLAFESARTAIRAATDIQRSTTDGPFAIRLGVHTGEVIHATGDLFGIAVNKAARIAAAANAGEIMASSTTRDLAGPVEGVTYGEPRVVALKGLSETHQIVPITYR